MPTLGDQETQRAVELVRAAYEEAMRRHGLLPSTVALISTYAEQNLAALEGEDHP